MSSSTFASCFPDFTNDPVALNAAAFDLKSKFGVDVGTPPTVSAVEIALVALMVDRTVAEIEGDPDGMGYAIKTDAQQAALLNLAPIDPVTHEPLQQPPRWVDITLGIPYSPNAATEAMVTEAKE